MKSKQLYYYQNIPIINLLEIIFDYRWKLDDLSNCLEICCKCLALSFDLPTLVRDVRQLFYLLYDEYAKFYGSSLNINFEQNVFSTQVPTSRIGKDY